jgi:uncharacterized membrane protein YfcA
MMAVIIIIISFIASIIGAVCGIGGGIIIKPTMAKVISVDSWEEVQI